MFSSWMKRFDQDSMRTNGLKYESCNGLVYDYTWLWSKFRTEVNSQRGILASWIEVFVTMYWFLCGKSKNLHCFLSLFRSCHSFWCQIFPKMFSQFTAWWLWKENPCKSADLGLPLSSGSFDAWSGSLTIWKMTSLLQNLKTVGMTSAESSGNSLCSRCSLLSSNHQLKTENHYHTETFPLWLPVDVMHCCISLICLSSPWIRSLISSLCSVNLPWVFSSDFFCFFWLVTNRIGSNKLIRYEHIECFIY